MTDAVIVSAVRTAVGKAPGGTLRLTRPDELAAAVIADEAVDQAEALVRGAFVEAKLAPEELPGRLEQAIGARWGGRPGAGQFAVAAAHQRPLQAHRLVEGEPLACALAVGLVLGDVDSA